MVYAASAEAYDTQRAVLSSLCAHAGFEDYFDYMEKNWNTSQDMWVMNRREKLAHFRNHTNNHLESYFGKLKEGLDKDSSMASCMLAVIVCDRRRAKEYIYSKLCPGRNVNVNYDEEISQVLMFTTRFVSEHILTEYKTAQLKCDIYELVLHFEPEFI